MSRLDLADNGMSAIIKMSDGNPGALTAIADIMEKHQRVDPQSAFGGMGVLLTFDDMGIYGTDIYILWNDKCKKDTRKLLMLLRAQQLGFISRDKVIFMAKDQMRNINLTEEEFNSLNEKVCEYLKEFKKA